MYPRIVPEKIGSFSEGLEYVHKINGLGTEQFQHVLDLAAAMYNLGKREGVSKAKDEMETAIGYLSVYLA